MPSIPTINEDDLYLCEDGSYEWEDKPFTGIAQTFYEDGTLSGEERYVDGLLDGVSRYFYGPNQLLGIETFRRNCRHGEAKEWWANGKMRRDAQLDNGFLVREKRWNEDGALTVDFLLSEDDPQYELLRSARKRAP